MALKKWNTNFRLEDSMRKNRTTLSDEFRCSRKFSAGMTQKGMCHLLFDQIFRRKLLVNGKQPLEIGNWKLEIGNFGEMPINEEGIPFERGSILSFLEWYRQSREIA